MTFKTMIVIFIEMMMILSFLPVLNKGYAQDSFREKSIILCEFNKNQESARCA